MSGHQDNKQEQISGENNIYQPGFIARRSLYLNNQVQPAPAPKKEHQEEYETILRILAGLSGEIKALRERSALNDKEQLKLLAAAAGAEAAQKTESATEYYRARFDDLQAQLSRLTVEFQRLATSTADLQAELAYRPTRADIVNLTTVVTRLQQDLVAKDQLIEHLQSATADRDVHTEPPEPAKEEEKLDASKILVSADVHEIIRLDLEDDDDETSSAAIEINRENEASECSADISATVDGQASPPGAPSTRKHTIPAVDHSPPPPKKSRLE